MHAQPKKDLVGEITELQCHGCGEKFLGNLHNAFGLLRLHLETECRAPLNVVDIALLIELGLYYFRMWQCYKCGYALYGFGLTEDDAI